MRSMSPMDAFGWFDAPVHTETVVPLTSIKQLLTIDSRRVVLIIGSNVTGGASVSVAPFAGITSAGGYAVGQNIPPLQFNHTDDAILTQTEWWCQNNSAGSVTVSTTEIRLKAWPDTEDEQVVAIEGLADVVNRLSKLLREIERGRYPATA